jgi:hypothetical protein
MSININHQKHLLIHLYYISQRQIKMAEINFKKPLSLRTIEKQFDTNYFNYMCTDANSGVRLYARKAEGSLENLIGTHDKKSVKIIGFNKQQKEWVSYESVSPNQAYIQVKKMSGIKNNFDELDKAMQDFLDTTETPEVKIYPGGLKGDPFGNLMLRIVEKFNNSPLFGRWNYIQENL